MKKLAIACALVFLLGVVGGAAEASPFASQAQAEESEPVKADRDDDKVFDDLESRLAALSRADALSVIVTLHAPATPERISALAGEVGSFAVSDRFAIIDGFAATMTKSQVQALADLPEVTHVEENSVVYALNNSAQESFGVTKARADAGVDGDADGNVDAYSKDDLVAAVIDTGIDPGHKDLDEGKVIAFKDFVNGRTEAYDDNGHGTRIAATLAGEGDARSDRLYKGAAPAAGLVGVKVLDAQAGGTMADVAAAIDWVVANKDVYGIEAINLSLATAGCSDGTDAASIAVNNAHDAGLVVVVAVGNSGPGTCTIGSPGAAAKALTVGAMADLGANGFKQADFSSRGPTADGRLKPDVSAPGVEIVTADGGTTDGYAELSGTSLAAPFVAGVALLMLDVNPTLTPQDVRDKILGTAVDWGRGGDNASAGSSGLDVDYGAGRLDAYAAIRAAGASIASPPVMPSHELREGTLSDTGDQVEYELNVADTQFPIAATLIVPAVSGSFASSAEPDFDLYLFDPSGELVAAAETRRRQDEFGYKPTVTGTYTLRVESSSGGGDFFLDISAGLEATPPVNLSPPTVSGTAREGETLTAASGSWTGSPPLSFSYRWQRCDSAGSSCGDIAEATKETYTVAPGDVGKTLRVIVTASNAAGSSSAASSATAVVAAPPVNVSLPTVSGTAREGETLTAASGSWTGSPPLSFSYRWQRCDSAGSSCGDIAEATKETYTVAPGDVGKALRVIVTASNAAGSSSAASNVTAVVAAAPAAGGSSGGAASSGPALAASARAPLCADSSEAAAARTPTTIALVCADPNGDPLARSIVSVPAHGTLGAIDQAAGTVTYIPDRGFAGNDLFTYKASDGARESNIATVRIAVAEEQDTAGPNVGIGPRVLLLSRAGIARLRVSCPAAETAGCRGSLTLKTARKVKPRPHGEARRVTLGKRAFWIAGGETAAVGIPLSEANQRLVRTLAEARVLAIAVARDGAGNARRTVRTITLKARVSTRG